MDETFTKILLDVKDEVTRVGTIVEQQVKNDIQMHSALSDKIDSLEKLMNEKMKSQDRRILNLESNQSKLVWIVISVVVCAVLGVVLIVPQI